MPDFGKVFELVYWVASALSGQAATPSNSIGWDIIKILLGAVLGAVVGGGFTLLGTWRSTQIVKKTSKQMREVQVATTRQIQEAQLAVKAVEIETESFKEWTDATWPFIVELRNFVDVSTIDADKHDRNKLGETRDQMLFAFGKAEVFLGEKIFAEVDKFVDLVSEIFKRTELIRAGGDDKVDCVTQEEFEGLINQYGSCHKAFRHELKLPEWDEHWQKVFSRILGLGQ